MTSYELTGKWYLKKKLFGYKVMVEVEATDTCIHTLIQSSAYKYYKKANDEDLIELGINCI